MKEKPATITVQVDTEEEIVFIYTDRTDFAEFVNELREAIECHFNCPPAFDETMLN